MNNILVIIPARAGSKGIKNKNIYPLCGKPLVEYTIDVVKEAGLEYVITTDDPIIKNNYLFTIDRPKHLATDTSHIIDEIKRIAKPGAKVYCRTGNSVFVKQRIPGQAYIDSIGRERGFTYVHPLQKATWSNADDIGVYSPSTRRNPTKTDAWIRVRWVWTWQVNK